MPFDASREGQLTEENLKWGYWWTTHKVQVRHALITFLSVLDVAFVLFAGYGFADWFFGTGVIERRAIAQLAQPLINYAHFRDLHAPQPVAFESAMVLPSGQGRYDFVARAENPNPLWVAQFSYHFTGNGLDTPTYHMQLLPREAHWIDALGVKSESPQSAATLVVDDVTWKRVDQHDTRPDYPTWAAERLHFSILDAAYVPPQQGDTVPTGRATFTARNDSAFSYRTVVFYVTLVSNSRVVGVNRVAVSSLRAGETRKVEAIWLNDLPSVSRVEVQPVVDIFDEGAYLAPER